MPLVRVMTALELVEEVDCNDASDDESREPED